MKGSNAPADRQPHTALDEGACIYGAGVLLEYLRALKQETAGVLKSQPDIEYIHRARVASRRLRAALPLFIDCFPPRKAKAWLKEIRKVTRALGAARDTDVQIEAVEAFSQELSGIRLEPGIRRLLLRLRQKRSALQPKVEQAMGHLFESGVLDEMDQRLELITSRSEEAYIYTSALYRHAENSITSRLDALLSDIDLIQQPENILELHEKRIQAKWLRYTLESFAGCYPNRLKPWIQPLRKMQDMLGEIHDCDVWAEFLPAFLEEEHARSFEFYGHNRMFNRLVAGVRCFQQNRSQIRSGRYQDFLAYWAEQENKWPGLRMIIQSPFPPPENVYPPLNEPPIP